MRNNLTGRYVPRLETLAELAALTDYTVLDQVRDLFDIPHDPENIWPPEQEGAWDSSERGDLWLPRYGQQHLLSRLHRALVESGAAIPTVAEIAQTVLRSCAETGDSDRWRARLFDVRGGWHFPHVAYNAVEFSRWYGPFRRPAQDLNLHIGEEYLRRAHIKAQRGLYVMPRDHYGETPTPTFLSPGTADPASRTRRGEQPCRQLIDPSVRQAWWDRFRKERAELGVRLQQTRFAARGMWEGTNEWLAMPIVSNARQIREDMAPRPRHLWLEPAARTVPDSHGFVTDLPRRNSSYRASTLVVVSPTGLNASRVSDLLAQGIGWDAVSLRDLIQRITGRRVLITDEVTQAMTREVLSQLAKDPPPQTVVWIDLRYLLFAEGRHRTLLREVVDALNTPSIQTVVMDSASPTNYDLWERRFSPPGADWGTTAPSATESTALIDQWIDETTPVVPGQVLARVNVVYPWSGPAVLADGAFAPAWYRHPLVDDFGLRAAYEMAAYFLEAPERPARFVPGQLLHRHQAPLQAAHGPKPLHNEAELGRFDLRYESPPPDDSRARRGSVLTFSAMGARTRADCRLPGACPVGGVTPHARGPRGHLTTSGEPMVMGNAPFASPRGMPSERCREPSPCVQSGFTRAHGGSVHVDGNPLPQSTKVDWNGNETIRCAKRQVRCISTTAEGGLSMSTKRE